MRCSTLAQVEVVKIRYMFSTWNPHSLQHTHTHSTIHKRFMVIPIKRDEPTTTLISPQYSNGIFSIDSLLFVELNNRNIAVRCTDRRSLCFGLCRTAPNLDGATSLVVPISDQPILQNIYVMG